MSSPLNPKQKFERLIDSIENILNDLVRRAVSNECDLKDENKLNPLSVAREAFARATLYGGSFNAAHESSILLEFFTGEGTKDYIIRRFYMCIYREMITWQSFDRELLLRILNVDPRTVDSRFMRYFSCTAAEAYERYRSDKISLAEPKLRWEDLSKTAQENFDSKEDTVINNTSGRYGVEDEALRIAMLARDLQSFYGLCDEEGEVAFHIHQQYHYDIELCFQYVYEHIWTFIPDDSEINTALRAQLPVYLRNRDTVFLFFEVRLSPEMVLLIRRKHALGQLQINRSTPLHTVAVSSVKTAISACAILSDAELQCNPILKWYYYHRGFVDLYHIFKEPLSELQFYGNAEDLGYIGAYDDYVCIHGELPEKEHYIQLDDFTDWDDFAYIDCSFELKDSLSEEEQMGYDRLRRFKALKIFSLLGKSDVLRQYHDWLRSVDLSDTDFLVENSSLLGEKLEEIVRDEGLLDAVNRIIAEAPALDFNVSDLAEEISDAAFIYNQRTSRIAYMLKLMLSDSGVLTELRKRLYARCRVDFAGTQPTPEQVIEELRSIVADINLDAKIKEIISPQPLDLSCFAYDFPSILQNREVSYLNPNEGFAYVLCTPYNYTHNDWGAMYIVHKCGLQQFISLETGEIVEKEYIPFDTRNKFSADSASPSDSIFRERQRQWQKRCEALDVKKRMILRAVQSRSQTTPSYEEPPIDLPKIDGIEFLDELEFAEIDTINTEWLETYELTPLTERQQDEMCYQISRKWNLLGL